MQLYSHHQSLPVFIVGGLVGRLIAHQSLPVFIVGGLVGRLKGLAVKFSRPSGRSASHTGLIGFNPRRLKGLKGDELPHNGRICLCEIFFSSSSGW